jgi:transmembrane sensor
MFDGEADSEVIEREAYEWVRCFASGVADSAELAALQQWSARSAAHREAFDRVSRAWQQLGSVGESAPRSGHIAVTSRSPLRGRRAFIGGAIAASTAVMATMVVKPPLGLWPSWSELSADYRTEPGEQRQVTLADNVSVELNTRSSMTLRPEGGDTRRVELIAGEAMISATSIAAGPVTVLAADGRVIATNASFNLRYDDPRSVCVTCLEGDVQVRRLGAMLPLRAGQQVVYSDQGIGPATSIDPAAVTAWQHGLVIFRSTPITEVVAEINRYRSGRVVLTNAKLGRRELNARFRIEDMDRVVGQIEQVFGAHATTLPGGILLLG